DGRAEMGEVVVVPGLHLGEVGLGFGEGGDEDRRAGGAAGLQEAREVGEHFGQGGDAHDGGVGRHGGGRKVDDDDVDLAAGESFDRFRRYGDEVGFDADGDAALGRGGE